MEDKNKTEQPGEELQRLLDSIKHASPTEVTFMGKTYKIGWLRKGTMEKCSHIAINEKDEWKRSVKACVAILLNDKWKIAFTYWFKWRWLYYIKDIDISEVLFVLDESKKKIPSTAYSLATILTTEMTRLMMTMTKEERKSIQAGQAGEKPSP